MVEQTSRIIYVRKGNLWSEKRVAAGFSLRELERITGISRGSLSLIEQGRSPTPAQYEKLRSAYLRESA